jgi:hypothetical protein
MPYKIEEDGFSLGLTANFGIQVRRPGAPVSDGPIVARLAKADEIDAINQVVRSREGMDLRSRGLDQKFLMSFDRSR